MADQKQSVRTGPLKRLAGLIQGNTDDLYKSTYYSDPTNKQQLQILKTDINDTIRDIMKSSVDNVGEPNISKLYERMLLNAQGDQSTINEFEKIFGDNDFINNLTATYLDNRWVKAVDTEIDEVLRYMPKLKEAIDILTDNVLSADSFSKDFLNISNTLQATDTTQEQFDSNIQDMKKIYKLPKLIKEIYEKTSMYGEAFVYCVPYEKAIQRLLDRKYDNRNVVVKTNLKEGAVEISTDGVAGSKIKINESANISVDDGFKPINISCQFESGIISSVVNAEKTARDKLMVVSESALSESMFDLDSLGRSYAYNKMGSAQFELDGKLPVHHRFDQTLGDALELPNDNNTYSDGLTDINQNKARATRIKGMSGAIVKVLARERVVPIIINDINLGYYYFEFDNDLQMFDERMSSMGMVNTITGIRANGRSEAFDAMQRREELLRSIASQLADKIDNTFVDNNQDLKKEIYYILKYNDDYNSAQGSINNIRVSYIPPEDIHHMYFELDERTSRGVSDLNLSLIPAKLWVAIYLTNALGIMTRGNDKRVYYVRQSVESNIAKTLLKTINEIKKANFGIRQIDNINSILNITGRYNDYIIPRGADGQSPIEFEVMQGQQIEIKTELLNILEESAINPTGVPIELTESRNSPDYATQLTMTNSKFLRFVYDRQSDFQDIISPLLSKIYDIEYMSTDVVTLTLPPPLFINVTNTNQLIVNTNDYCDNIVNILMADEQDEAKKQMFAKKLKIYHLGSYINMKLINELLKEADQEYTLKKLQTSSEEDTGGGY